MTDNRMPFNIRNIVDYKKRRFTRGLLHEQIGRAVLATDNKVVPASATFEIIRIPDINLEPGAANRQTWLTIHASAGSTSLATALLQTLPSFTFKAIPV